MDSNTKLNNTWNLWYHHEKDNWKLTGYKKIYTADTIGDFWRLNNNWNKLGGINGKHFFFMKDEITPLWEDPSNVNGGCWSFKVFEDQSEKLWVDLCSYMVTDEITSNPSDIVGISICLKKNNNSVIKVWNKDSKNNSLSFINKDILKKWGYDIIYIAHMPEN